MSQFPQIHLETRSLLDDVPASSRRSNWNPEYSSPVVETPEFETFAEEIIHPFKLVYGARIDEWKVRSEGSSVVDGLSGTAFEITGMDTAKTQDGVVVIEADVDPSLVVSNMRVVEAAPITDEVTITSGQQTAMRFVVGKIYRVGGSMRISQACWSAQRVVTAFYNGMMVKVFAPSPSHPSSLGS